MDVNVKDIVSVFKRNIKGYDFKNVSREKRSEVEQEVMDNSVAFLNPSVKFRELEKVEKEAFDKAGIKFSPFEKALKTQEKQNDMEKEFAWSALQDYMRQQGE